MQSSNFVHVQSTCYSMFPLSTVYGSYGKESSVKSNQTPFWGTYDVEDLLFRECISEMISSHMTSFKNCQSS